MVRTYDRRRFAGAALGAGLALTGGRFVAAQSTPAASPAASPVSITVGNGPARLVSMLAATPAHALSQTGVTWADVGSAWKLAGLDPLRPGSTKIDSAHLRVLQSLAVPSHTFEYAMVPDYATTFGFNAFAIEQGLQIGDPPDVITLLRGAWKRTDLIRAWRASKYQEKKTAAGTVWSWADGPRLDVKDPVSRYGLGGMNNAAFLPDGTVVFASSIATVTLALRTASGAEASIIGDDRIAGLVASTPPTLVSALILPGKSLQQADAAALIGAADPSAVATMVARLRTEEQAAVGTMPRPSFGLLGVTGGNEPHVIVRLAVKNAGEADRAAKIMAYRLDHDQSIVTRQPYSDILTLVSAEGQAEPPVARADFAPTRPGYVNFWIKMVYSRDLGLVGW